MKSRYPCQDRSTNPTSTTTTTNSADARVFQETVMLRWKPTKRKRRQYTLFSLLAFFLIFLLTFHHRLGPDQLTRPSRRANLYERTPHPLKDRHVPFWKSLNGLIRNNNPQCKKKPDLVIPQDADIRFDPSHNHPRPDLLWIDDADVTRLRSAHANFVSDIRSHALTLAYEPGTRGIVTVASEPLLATLAVSLRMLRKTSSTLPVEIFLRSPSPQSEAFCANVFPELDAKCFYISDIFAAADTVSSPTMNQSKVLAILFSSFEDVLLIDPCSFPTTAPEPLFHSMPFTGSGLILWPDFWYAGESPYFFDIAKISDIPALHTKAAVQSSEIMYSKPKHTESLMLAMYYNIYGPDYYYLLQSQGGPGAGEKETFGLAAMALNESVYYVRQGVRSLGRHNENDDWIGTGMIQFDPVADFFSLGYNRVPVVQPEDIAHPSLNQKWAKASVKPMFVHADFPKFDPQSVLSQDSSSINPAMKDANGTPVRSWMPATEAIELFGFDIEKRLWGEIEESACGSLLGLWLEEGKPDWRALDLVKRRDTELCNKVKDYNAKVFSVPQT